SQQQNGNAIQSLPPQLPRMAAGGALTPGSLPNAGRVSALAAAESGFPVQNGNLGANPFLNGRRSTGHPAGQSPRGAWGSDRFLATFPIPEANPRVGERPLSEVEG